MWRREQENLKNTSAGCSPITISGRPTWEPDSRTHESKWTNPPYPIPWAHGHENRSVSSMRLLSWLHGGTKCLVDLHGIVWCTPSYEEVAIYLQTYKAFENKSADSIKERVDQDYSSILRAALTSIKGVNKTDVVSLRTHFGVSGHVSLPSTTHPFISGSLSPT